MKFLYLSVLLCFSSVSSKVLKAEKCPIPEQIKPCICQESQNHVEEIEIWCGNIDNTTEIERIFQRYSRSMFSKLSVTRVKPPSAVARPWSRWEEVVTFQTQKKNKNRKPGKREVFQKSLKIPENPRNSLKIPGNP